MVLKQLPPNLRKKVDKAKKMINKYPNRKNRWASDYAKKFNLEPRICVRAVWELNEEDKQKG